MEQINNSNRCCATCVHWLGQRQPHRLGYVLVASKMNGGRCGVKRLDESRRYQAIYNCDSYCKWSTLK